MGNKCWNRNTSVRSRIYASIVRLPAVMPGPARICADLFRVSGYPGIRPSGHPVAPGAAPRAASPPPTASSEVFWARSGARGDARPHLTPTLSAPRGGEGEKAGAAWPLPRGEGRERRPVPLASPPPPFRGEGRQGEVGASVQCPARDGRMRLRGAPASRAPRAWTRIARPARVDARRQVRAGQAMTACGRDRIGGCAHRSNIMRTSESGHRLGLAEQEIRAVLLSWGYSIALNDFFYLRVGLSNDRVYCF